MRPRAVPGLALSLFALACARPDGGERSRTKPPERVGPLVLTPGEIGAGGALPVAAIFPTLGRYAVSGLQSLQGAQLAVEDLNRAGGINGRPLRLAEYRTGSYFVDARQAAVDAARDGALAIVGSNSSELSAAVAEEAEARGVLQVTNVSTAADLNFDPRTGRARPFFFRMCASDEVMGALLADFAGERLGVRRAAVLFEIGRTYSARLARTFTTRFREASPGREVAEFHYLALETDFRPQLRRIMEYRPDVLFVPGSFPDASLVAVQSRELGLRTRLLGGDAWSSPLLFQRGAPLGEAYYVELCSPAPEFDRRYEAAVGAEPPGCRAVLAYDAVRVIAHALAKMGRLDAPALSGEGLASTRRRLRDVVAGSEVDGVTGRIRFDDLGNRRQGVALYAVEPGPEGRPRALVRGWLGEP
jgi:branched-chain amino acid transport system substrate-binding protein